MMMNADAGSGVVLGGVWSIAIDSRCSGSLDEEKLTPSCEAVK